MNDRHEIIMCFTKMINYLSRQRIDEQDVEKKALLEKSYFLILEAYDNFLKVEFI